MTDLTLADRLWGLRRNAKRVQQAGALSAAEASDWTESLEQAGRSGRFFAAVTGFAVREHKP